MGRLMKYSGVEWLGEIPSDWNVNRLQWHLEEIKVQNSPIQSEQVLSLTIEAGVIPYEEKGNQGNKAKENYEEYKLAYPETLVVNSMNVIIGAVGISRYFGCVSPVYYVFKATEGTDLRYIYYLFTNVGFQKEMRKYAKGILEIRLRISASDMLKRMIPKVSYEEQCHISDFLDKKCTDIETVIAKTKETIEEYKKLKQSVITEAVTKGVRGSKRNMKESGIEWIPKIANEWKISRVGLHYNIILGKMLCDKQLQGDYTLEDYFCAANVHFEGIDIHGLKKMWFSPSEKEAYGVSIGDLLVVEGGAGAGGASIVGRLENPTYIQNSIMIVRGKKESSNRFLRYWIECLVKRGYISVVCNKATIPHFTKDKLANMPVPVLSEKEMFEITEYLDKKCDEIDTLIAIKTTLLEELEAYKKSLIYEYVTGKKEVPDGVI